MPDSTVSASSRKASTQNDWTKPYDDFPLSYHPPSGRLYKKIRGRRFYFGYASDWQAALDKFLAEKDDRYAGREPRIHRDGVTVRELCNEFLTAKRHLLDTRGILPRTFQEYHNVCQRVIKQFGKERLVEDLGPNDFQRLRTTMAKSLGPVGLHNEIGRVRMIFKFALDQGLIPQPVLYGQGFKRPTRKDLRKARAKNGKRMFEADELRKIIDAASQPLKAMVLLGINCGFGQTDIANLPIDAIDLDAGWIDFARVKTGIERRCPLWPETVAAVREALAGRSKPHGDTNGKLAFLTRQGRQWVRTNKNRTPNDEIGKAFAKLLRELNLKRPGISFYALRHTFETIGGESKDQVAVNAIMGHVDDSMAATYREQISDQRLTAVTDTVHAWLFPPEADDDQQEGGDDE